jgi:hypothetical protein
MNGNETVFHLEKGGEDGNSGSGATSCKVVTSSTLFQTPHIACIMIMVLIFILFYFFMLKIEKKNYKD